MDHKEYTFFPEKRKEMTFEDARIYLICRGYSVTQEYHGKWSLWPEWVHGTHWKEMTEEMVLPYFDRIIAEIGERRK